MSERFEPRRLDAVQNSLAQVKVRPDFFFWAFPLTASAFLLASLPSRPLLIKSLWVNFRLICPSVLYWKRWRETSSRVWLKLSKQQKEGMEPRLVSNPEVSERTRTCAGGGHVGEGGGYEG